MARLGRPLGRYRAILSLFAMMVAALFSSGQARADGLDIARAAEERTRHQVIYDPSYVRLAYPGGDVAPDRGVCTDVVIRTYRAIGVDLQKLVHEDMRRAFGKYPRTWGLKRPDPNIDHRRVPNLEVFLARQGAEVPANDDASDYLPGDIVTWRLPDGRPHMGVVSTRSAPSGRPLIAHNIGAGPKLEDMLFEYAVHRHFRWQPTR